jgi:homocysteine S-methyltransferase
MTAEQATDYHAVQVGMLADSGADLVTSFTLTYADEGIGVAAAAAARGIPSVVGFTVETDGRLPSGQPLGEAIDEVDAATGAAPAWFMVNCAHPDHILAGLPDQPQPWAARVGALRANGSRMSHAELDAAETLDDGDPADLAEGYVRLRDLLPAVRVIGGCCGTDVRHVAEVAKAWSTGA